ncbi:rhodanese-like domain-containing protein [Monaibacterium marinum]|nr:rhodanese-like domain-containing protein [Monaibacterium marinum]
MKPQDAYDTLRSNPAAVLVDVRTQAEWNFVGIPDTRELGNAIALVQWMQFPDMAVNSAFSQELTQQLGGEIPDTLLFICRSGARSHNAAQMIAQQMSDAGRDIRCINVAEGFEGDLDPSAHRGHVNGWKAAALPWRQT